jgi:hypothetical protein
MHTWLLWGHPREGDPLKDPDIDGRIILKYVFDEWDGVID